MPALLSGCSALVTAPPRLHDRPCRANEVNLTAIARRLGIVDAAPRNIIRKVRLLADKHSFPLPKTPRFVNDVRMAGADSIDARSIWDRDPVDLWFENDRPPMEAAAVTFARRSAARDDMRARAQQLVAA